MHCSPTYRPSSDFQGSDTDGLSDEEILERFRKYTRLSPIEHPYAEDNIVRITDDTVGKFSQDLDEEVDESSEAVALRVVFEHTSIPVPRVRRVIKLKWTHLIVMDYIRGRQLSTVWHSLSTHEKAKVAATLQDYVHQLREVNIPRRQVPGPLASDGARTCESPPIFGQVISSRGPFATYDELATFFEGRRLLAIRQDLATTSTLPHFDISSPLVLTHQDLNPRNLIVGDDGRLWLVDWSWAGFYPEWWEYLAMKAQSQNEEQLTGKKDKSWEDIIPIVCGSFEEQEKWLYEIGGALDWK